MRAASQNPAGKSQLSLRNPTSNPQHCTVVLCLTLATQRPQQSCAEGVPDTPRLFLSSSVNVPHLSACCPLTGIACSRNELTASVCAWILYLIPTAALARLAATGHGVAAAFTYVLLRV